MTLSPTLGEPTQIIYEWELQSSYKFDRDNKDLCSFPKPTAVHRKEEPETDYSSPNFHGGVGASEHSTLSNALRLFYLFQGSRRHSHPWTSPHLSPLWRQLVHALLLLSTSARTTDSLLGSGGETILDTHYDMASRASCSR